MTAPAAGTLGQIDARAVPELDFLLDGARRAFERSPRWACRHVAAAGVGVLCVTHPKLGILCPSCHRQHLQRHSNEDEHRCDRCGSVVAAIIGIVGTLTGAVRVREPRGRTGILAGRVFAGGLGLCVPCHVASANRKAVA